MNLVTARAGDTELTPEEALRQLAPEEVRAFVAAHGDREAALMANRYLLQLLKLDPPAGQTEAYLTTLRVAARDVAAALQAFVLADIHGRHEKGTEQ